MYLGGVVAPARDPAPPAMPPLWGVGGDGADTVTTDERIPQCQTARSARMPSLGRLASDRQLSLHTPKRPASRHCARPPSGVAGRSPPVVSDCSCQRPPPGRAAGRESGYGELVMVVAAGDRARCSGIDAGDAFRAIDWDCTDAASHILASRCRVPS
jgi:hypothetical protein